MASGVLPDDDAMRAMPRWDPDLRILRPGWRRVMLMIAGTLLTAAAAGTGLWLARQVWGN